MNSFCKVWINGKEMEVDPERKLLDVLRNDCKCKSVKVPGLYGSCRRSCLLGDDDRKLLRNIPGAHHYYKAATDETGADRLFHCRRPLRRFRVGRPHTSGSGAAFPGRRLYQRAGSDLYVFPDAASRDRACLCRQRGRSYDHPGTFGSRHYSHLYYHTGSRIQFYAVFCPGRNLCCPDGYFCPLPAGTEPEEKGRINRGI